MGGRQIQMKPKTIEILFYIIEAWVPFLKGQLSGELRLTGGLEPGRKSSDTDLRTFRVKISTEALKMGAEMQNETAQAFIEKENVGRSRRRQGGTVGFHLVQAKVAVEPPSLQGRRGHRSLVSYAAALKIRFRAVLSSTGSMSRALKTGLTTSRR